MNYLLDTNACIAIFNGWPIAVRDNLARAIARKHKIYISTVVAFELWYGVAKSVRGPKNEERLKTFFSGPVELLPFDADDARSAGMIRAQLETQGRPIGAYDLLIAGQALRREMTVITANTREFSRIAALQWQDWARE
ncbi:MAG: type II toxin-antitoxin system VapC family toxin [Phycisphaerae bacterium]